MYRVTPMAIELDNVDAGYGRLQILFDINVEFPDKEITVIVGPNGSGKSTLLKTIFGITRVYRGKIRFNGADITGKPPHVIASMGIAYLPQTNNVFDNLTVEENLKMAGYKVDQSKLEERIEHALQYFPILKAYMKRKARQMSGGERQMLAMAMALIRSPKVMMFDEPTAALAPKLAFQVLNIIEKLRDDLGITVILVEQNAKIALEKGDNAILLASGRVIYKGSSRKLLNDPELGSLYLGLTKRGEAK